MSNAPIDLRSAFADLPELSRWLADLHTPIDVEPAARLINAGAEIGLPDDWGVDLESRRLRGEHLGPMPRRTEGGEAT